MKWKLLITRETDLLERYLRVFGYSKMFGNKSKIKVKNLLIVNHNGLNRQYILASELKQRQKLIRKEYNSINFDELIGFWNFWSNDFNTVVNKSLKDKTEINFIDFVREYCFGRAIVFYTEVLSKVLQEDNNLDKINLIEYWHETAEILTSKAWDKVKLSFDIKIGCYFPKELAEFLTYGRKVTSAKLLARKKYYVMLLKNDKINFYFGKKARRFEIKELPENIKQKGISEIKGASAYHGIVKGKVRIVNTLKEMKQMRKGEVLVSTMTTPRLFEAVKKASAIVTDEGGITCHAAIVAREMKKPCVIGTKIATRVFKDGNMVEVDATKGIVRKIS